MVERPRVDDAPKPCPLVAAEAFEQPAVVVDRMRVDAIATIADGLESAPRFDPEATSPLLLEAVAERSSHPFGPREDEPVALHLAPLRLQERGRLPDRLIKPI